MLRVVVLRVLFFVDMRLPVFRPLIVLSEVVYVKEADQLIRYLRHNYDYLTWFDGLHARCDM